MINLTKNNKLFILISLLTTLLAAFAIYMWGLKFSIDFAGGTIIEYQFTDNLSQDNAGKDFFKTENLPEIIKIVGEGSNKTKYYFNPLTDEQITSINSSITQKASGSKRVSVETITSEVGKEQSINAIKAIAFASLGIILFLAYAFREVPKPFSSWEFGISAVIALLHDAMVVVGVFALVGHYLNYQIDMMFIVAILTVIGFSVHDTIVVFDRIRENLKLGATNYLNVVNKSLLETLARSVNLSWTAVVVLISMFVLGPLPLKGFVLALLVGMVSGTYSSIFVATQFFNIFYFSLKKPFQSEGF